MTIQRKEGDMGTVTVTRLTEKELRARGVFSWPIWEKEVSRFDWSYDSVEECYFLAGNVIVETPAGEISIGPGDFVTFPKGLRCVWRVLEPVRKQYRFL